jgi:hypothetical protein
VIRTLLVVALVANAVAFAWWRGLLPAEWSPGFAEADRSRSQVAPESVALVPLDRLRPKSTTLACTELGPMEALVGERLLTITDELGSQVQVEALEQEAQGGWLAYVPNNGDPRAMERRFSAIKQLGYAQANILQEASVRGAIGLGLYRTANEAKEVAVNVANKSGLELRVTEVTRPVPRMVFRVRYPVVTDGGPDPIQARITGLKIELGLAGAPCRS